MQKKSFSRLTKTARCFPQLHAWRASQLEKNVRPAAVAVPLADGLHSQVIVLEYVHILLFYSQHQSQSKNAQTHRPSQHGS